jgi:peptide-methionine (R)-S-oxide reductase
MFKILKRTKFCKVLNSQKNFKNQTSTFIGSETPMSKNLTEEEWKVKLSPAAFKVLRLKGTERPGTGEYDKFYEKGIYNCGGCGTPLYTSEMKFNSGCGWPAFFDAIPGALTTHTDTSFGMERIEIMCKACGGHLGHIFKGEGFDTPTNERHCVNSISIKFQKKE